ncbi:MAG: nucleotide exchange factor GrpE [Paludibacter sp.]|nr:nucleotide exchange factor GrpE [Paludibacter sp.]
MSNKHKYQNHKNIDKNIQGSVLPENKTVDALSKEEDASQANVLTELREVGVDTVEQKEKDLREEYNNLIDNNLRLLAEFDNYRKRTVKEKADLINIATANLFREMLPLIDDFERARQALESTSDILAVVEGVDLIYQKFVQFLTQHGIKEIVTKNEDFNTELHEAVTLFPASSEEEKGKIIDCISKGYTLNDKVIRFAKVVVGQ